MKSKKQYEERKKFRKDRIETRVIVITFFILGVLCFINFLFIASDVLSNWALLYFLTGVILVITSMFIAFCNHIEYYLKCKLGELKSWKELKQKFEVEDGK